MFGLDKNNPRLTMAIVAAEHRLPDVEGAPPPESSARYRHTGVGRALALAGVVVGFALLIFPGALAWRSYRRWRDGEAAEPRAAWTVLAIGFGVGVGAALWQWSSWVAVAAAVIAASIGLALASP